MSESLKSAILFVNWRRTAWAVASLFCLSSFTWAGPTGTPGLLFSPDAEVTDFAATSDGVKTSIHWKSGMEMGVNAYKVTSEDIHGTTQTVGLVRARLGDQNSYELEDPAALVGDQMKYNLFIISNYGDTQIDQWEGEIEIAEEVPEPIAMVAAIESAEESIPVSERKCWIGNVDRVKAWTNAAPADRIRFSLTEEGIYKVTAQEITDAGGWDFDAVTNALATTNFSMSCQGEDIAWNPLDDGLIFYGVEAESRWAPENVYWIEFGPGQNMAHIDGTPPEIGTTNQWFMDTKFVQGTDSITRVYAYHTLANEPISFLAFSPGLFSVGKSQVEAVLLEDCDANLWQGEVSVNLISMYDALDPSEDSQTNQVSLGSTVLGSSTWLGEKSVSFSYPFSSTNLVDGVANIEVKNIAIVPDFVSDFTHFYWVSCEISYHRLYQAKDGALSCSGGGGDCVSISGFTTNENIILDTSDTNIPSLVNLYSSSFNNVSLNWSVTFSSGASNINYTACSKNAGLRLPAIRGVRNLNLADSSNSVEYVILVPPEGWVVGFRAVLQELANYRVAQGLTTSIVDVETLYNEFSQGLVDPQAIKDFCAVGRTNWIDQPLSYLLFAGDGTVDFKHERFSVDDYTACLIPTILGGQGFSGGEAAIVALDSLYGDIDGDGAPEIAIGRLPTTSIVDLSTVIEKTLYYESALLRTNGVLTKKYAVLAPDWNNVSPDYYDFEGAVENLIAPVEAAGRIHVPCRVDPDNPTDWETVRLNTLFPALQSGVGLFHFFGHSNSRRLGYNYPGLITHYPPSNSDYSAGRWESPFIAIAIGCNNNPWQWLREGPTLIADGLFATNSGFVAGLGSTGYELTDEGEDMCFHLHYEAGQNVRVRLGDIYKNSLRAAVENARDPMRLPLPERGQFLDRIHCLSLVGDPSLVYRHDITALGTDVEWLVEHGQTNANADVEDVDGDGWQTWREYQADTNPTNNTLQVVGAGMDTNSGAPIISFETTSTNSYQLEYKSNLDSSNSWNAVSWSVDGIDWNPAETNIVPSGPVETVMVPESTIATQGFFRVRTVE